MIDIFRKKTSPALEVALKLGAILAGHGNELGQALKQYSESLGIAYQICDDIDDFRSKNKGIQWPLSARNEDGGWDGINSAKSTIEETAVAVDALAEIQLHSTSNTYEDKNIQAAISCGDRWLTKQTNQGNITNSFVDRFILCTALVL